MSIRDINFDFLSTQKTFYIYDVYSPEETPFRFDNQTQQREGDAISLFFHQVKQNLTAQVDNDVWEAEGQLECIEELSNRFDLLMLELDGYRKGGKPFPHRDEIVPITFKEKSTPEKEC